MKELRVVLFHEPVRGELCMTCEGCKGIAMGGRGLTLNPQYSPPALICVHIRSMLYPDGAMNPAVETALFLRVPGELGAV